MQREGDLIFFNPGEQQAFNVHPFMPTSDALQVAQVFRQTAITLSEKAADLNENSHDDMRKLPLMLGRATQLRTFADCIENTCTVEQILEYLDRKDA